MIQTLSWEARKARIWFNELPAWTYAPIEIVEYDVASLSQSSGIKTSAAVELVVPIGGRIYYGILGGSFVPQEKASITIQIPLTDRYGPLLQDTIIHSAEEVRVGFPREYLEGIVTGVKQSKTLSLLGSGTLYFGNAAHGMYGSSIVFFRILCSIIITLLSLNQKDVSSEALIEIIQKNVLYK